ncbi:MAG: AAA family ATPase [Bacteroidota bacterium]
MSAKKNNKEQSIIFRNKPIISIYGPKASGKTMLAESIAANYNGYEVRRVNSSSENIYKILEKRKYSDLIKLMIIDEVHKQLDIDRIMHALEISPIMHESKNRLITIPQLIFTGSFCHEIGSIWKIKFFQFGLNR